MDPTAAKMGRRDGKQADVMAMLASTQDQMAELAVV